MDLDSLARLPSHRAVRFAANANHLLIVRSSSSTLRAQPPLRARVESRLIPVISDAHRELITSRPPPDEEAETRPARDAENLPLSVMIISDCKNSRSDGRRSLHLSCIASPPETTIR